MRLAASQFQLKFSPGPLTFVVSQIYQSQLIQECEGGLITEVICLRMMLSWHSVVQGCLQCLIVHFYLHFSGGQVSRAVVLNFLAFLQSLDHLINPVYSTAAQACCHSFAPWGESWGRPVAIVDVSRQRAP